MIDGDAERKAGSLFIFSKAIAEERKAAAAAASGSNPIGLGPPTA